MMNPKLAIGLLAGAPAAAWGISGLSLGKQSPDTVDWKPDLETNTGPLASGYSPNLGSWDEKWKPGPWSDGYNITSSNPTEISTNYRPGSGGALPLALGGLALGGAGLLGVRALLARRRAAMVPPVPEVVPEVPSKGLLASAAEFGKQNWKPLALAGAGLYAANKIFGKKE